MTEQGYALKQAAKSLGISSQSIREQKGKLAKDGVYPVEVACEVLNACRSGCCAWRGRPAGRTG